MPTLKIKVNKLHGANGFNRTDGRGIGVELEVEISDNQMLDAILDMRERLPHESLDMIEVMA